MYCRYWRVCNWRVLSDWVCLLQQHRGKFHLHLLQRVLLFANPSRMYRWVTHNNTHSATTLERRNLLKCTKNDKWSIWTVFAPSHTEWITSHMCGLRHTWVDYVTPVLFSWIQYGTRATNTHPAGMFFYARFSICIYFCTAETCSCCCEKSRMVRTWCDAMCDIGEIFHDIQTIISHSPAMLQVTLRSSYTLGTK